METHNNKLFHKRPFIKSKVPSVKWFKEWVPHDVATGGKCFVLKWVNEATLNALNMSKERELVESAEPEPTTEVLFLCSYAGCGKTFVDAGALRTHSQIHGQRQHVCLCSYAGCGKTFIDAGALRKHSQIHGQIQHVCHYQNCGKPFSPEFNLRSHMKTHTQKNYHTSLYPECGKNYTHDFTLKNGITSHHDKPHAQNAADAPPRYSLVGKPVKAQTMFPTLNCPYKGCIKTYIRPHKLDLHLRREHPGHFPEEKAKIAQPCNNSNYYIEKKLDEENDQKGHVGTSNVQRLNRPPSKVTQQNYAVASLSNLSSMVNRP